HARRRLCGRHERQRTRLHAGLRLPGLSGGPAGRPAARAPARPGAGRRSVCAAKRLSALLPRPRDRSAGRPEARAHTRPGAGGRSLCSAERLSALLPRRHAKVNAGLEPFSVAHEPALTITVQVPAALAAGTAAALAWRISNNGLQPLAANFY